jgi:type VI secretion system FHA domain protein
MPIKVNISISAGGRFKPVSSHTLHDKRITIGRDKECTITLEDTQKHVSRAHAEFEEQDGTYWLKVVSKVNPVVVNGKRLMFGERATLTDGDHVSIGLYKLEIVEARVPPPPPARVEPPKHAVERPEDITYVARRSDFPSRTPAPPAELPDSAAENPDATFIRPPKPAVPVAPPPKASPPAALGDTADAEEATYVPPVKTPVPPPAAPPPAVRTTLPDTAFADDEVTYIPPMWARPPSARTSTTEPAPGTNDNAEEDMTNFRRPPAEETSPQKAVEPPAGVDFDLTDAFAEEETSVRPAPAPAPEVRPAPPPAPEVEEGFSEDLTYVRRPGPLTAPPPTPTPEPAVPAYTEAERLAEEETQYRSPVPAIGPRAAPAGPAAEATGNDRAVQAFLEGAGLADLAVADAESFMRNTGVMVRAAVEGVMMLLLARAEARKELGAEPEDAAGDNPLTSMASPAEVIAFLFDPRRPAIGDTDPVHAFGEACADLRAHQVALLTGMRAAVLSALTRIDPKKIEREHGVNLGGLNLTRKSKLWDISVAQHEQLAREMEENFSGVFNREILAAYTAQVRKVRGGR